MTGVYSNVLSLSSVQFSIMIPALAYGDNFPPADLHFLGSRVSLPSAIPHIALKPLVVGLNPLKDASKMKRGNYLINIYSDEKFPAICTENMGTHGLLHEFFIDEMHKAGLRLTPEEKHKLCDYQVSGFVELLNDKVIIKIRPDGSHDSILQSLQILRAAGIPDEKVLLMSDLDDQFEKVKNLGLMHKTNDCLTLSQTDIQSYLKNAYQTLPSGNQLYYARSSGERFIIPETFRELLRKINNPKIAYTRLKELRDLTFTHSLSRKESCNAVFLLVDTNKNRNKNGFDLMNIKNKFLGLCEKVLGIDTLQIDKQTAQKEISSFIKYFESHTNPFFHNSQCDNPEWCRLMYGFLRYEDVKALSYQTHLERLSTPLTGGYIGWYDENNLAHYGAKTMDMKNARIEYSLSEEEKLGLARGSTLILSPERACEQSVLTLVPVLRKADLKIEARSYIFHPGADHSVIKILNNCLRENPLLEYASCLDISNSSLAKNSNMRILLYKENGKGEEKKFLSL